MAELADYNIGVLMGGISSEREISLKSGRAVVKALQEAGLKVEPIYINSEDKKIVAKLIKDSKVNLVFIALHGKFGEDGQIQSVLESLKISYTGSGVKASEIAMDKFLSRKYFLRDKLNIPSFKCLEKSSFNSALLKDLFDFPLVVKPATQGSSIGLSIVDNNAELQKALELAFTFDEKILIEEYIKGREFTVGILEDIPLPIVEIIPKDKFFDYKAKYLSGLTEYVVPAVIEEKIACQIRKAALVAHKALGCFGCSRVDLILDERKRPVVLEVNTIPGMTQTSLLPKAALNVGIDFPQLCRKLLKLALDEKKK